MFKFYVNTLKALMSHTKLEWEGINTKNIWLCAAILSMLGVPFELETPIGKPLNRYFSIRTLSGTAFISHTSIGHSEGLLDFIPGPFLEGPTCYVEADEAAILLSVHAEKQIKENEDRWRTRAQEKES